MSEEKCGVISFCIVANRVAGLKVKIVDTSEEVLSKSSKFIGIFLKVSFKFREMA